MTLSRDELPGTDTTSRFEDLTTFPVTGIAALRLAPPWVLALVTVALAIVGVAAAPPIPVLKALFPVGSYTIVFVVIRTWLVTVARTRRYLVGRRDWSDATRLAILGGVFLGTSALVLVLTVVLIMAPGYVAWLLSRSPD